MDGPASTFANGPLAALAGAASGTAPQGRWLAPAAPLELAAALAAGTALSWALTGHVFGHNNNVFHLPILAGLAGEPGFAGDAFVQSLVRFSSGLWMLLAGSDAWWPAPLALPLLLAASKLLTLCGLLAVARALGLAGRGPSWLFVALMAATPLLQGTAYAGHGGLFIEHFSHSELANGLTLLMWWAGLRRRHGLALALDGGVFFLNAFMAAWNLLPWLWLLLGEARRDGPREQVGIGRAGRQGSEGAAARTVLRARALPLLGGLAVAALLAAPVLVRAWTSGLVDPAPAGFDARAFVRSYYPYHFLSSEMPLAQWLGLAVVAAAALVGLARLGPGARGLRRIFFGYAIVYAIGVLLPLVSDARFVINLHLLRVSVHAHFIAAIALGLLLVMSTSAQPGRRAGLALALLTARPALAGVLLWPLWRLTLVRRALQRPAMLQRLRAAPGVAALSARPWLLPAAAVLAVVTWQAATLPARFERLHARVESAAHWQALAQRIGALTPPGAQVLLPLETESWLPPDAGSGVFEYASHRSVWVDWKRGAAALWQPALHAQWRRRVDEVGALGSWPERLAYAADRGLAMVVGRCDDLPAELAPQLEPQLRAGHLCALRPGGAAGGR
jgi:hypothetical protein